ncbi:hypothetical protein GCM10022254_62180 [Actinomadura meridiana]|uniref:NlpC/P60 domain-containing protein n=1 Tax=Actinomadura meridiana TaxID=559626 RepID=A0ABP8CIU5_9ACTN
MKGKHDKHDKNRFPFGPRTTGAVLGLAFCGVVAATAQVTLSSDGDSGARSGAPVTAAEFLTPEKSDGHADASSEKSDDTSDRKDGERSSNSAKSARTKVIERARSWNPHTSDRVPYSQTRTHEGYRTDCSGFVAMALGLPGPGPNTVGFTSSRYTERISMDELKKGDLVMDAEGTNTTRHVVIFEKWANGKHTSYWAFEQRGRYGTDHRTRDYGLSSGSEYKAYRPKNL